MSAASDSRQQHAEQRVEVTLGERSYGVHIGIDILASAGQRIREAVGPRKVAIVSDSNVAEHYLAPLEASLDDAGIEHAARIIEPGEQTKSFAEFQNLCEWLLDEGIERGDAVIALGGGVVGDLTGFAASALRRGTGFVQIPTTLLAQVDSSVGGKTGINAPHGKNLIGAFYQPQLVLADIATLETLPPRELRAGYAEVVKYGLINKPEFFDWLEENGKTLLDGDREARMRAVTESVKAKAKIVAADEREGGLRALLNLGHTFGHALEAFAGYGGALKHGEGVAIGMLLAFRLSAARGICPPEDVLRVEEHLAACGLPTGLDAFDDVPSADELLGYMEQDKKVRAGRLIFILAKGIGKAFICDDVSREDVANILSS